MEIVLTIAGSDTSAGAGIQQDLKTITNCRCYGATVITAITSQNTMGVQGVMPVPAKVVESQIRSVLDDLDVKAIKIGMIPNTEVAEAIVCTFKDLASNKHIPIVLDPIMISTSGTRLMTEDCVQYIVKELFPICTLITPNIPEYEYLQEHTDIDFTKLNTLRKGGHGEGNQSIDILCLANSSELVEFSSPRIATKNLHGTGCTLSSAIASHLALGKDLPTAVSAAKEYMTVAILGGKNLNIGHGNGPLWYEQ